MSVQTAEPATPPGGLPRPRQGEFHPIDVRLASDTTEVECAVCGPLADAGVGVWQGVAHGADHAITTGHTVTERHVRLTVIRQRRVKPEEDS
jgi:hypothetical protein